MREELSTDAAPKPMAAYSQAVKAGNLVFTAGQIGLDPKTNALVEGGVEAQARQALENLKAVLAAASLTLDDVVKATVFLSGIDDFRAVNTIYEGFFSRPFPARSAFAVKELPAGALVEIEVIAAAG